jgi:AcrR family transcriptional regulator
MTGNQDKEQGPRARKRKQEIMDAALAVFSRKGFDGSRTKEIAQEAGISEATIFKYFPTKHDLLMAIIKPVVELVAGPVFLKPLDKLVASHAGRPLEATLNAIMVDRLRLFEKNENFIRTALFETWRQPEMLEPLRELLFPALVRIMKPVFDEACRQGEIPPDSDFRLITRSFMGTLIGYGVLIRLNPDFFRIEKELEADVALTIRLFMRGICQRNDSITEERHA